MKRTLLVMSLFCLCTFIGCLDKQDPASSDLPGSNHKLCGNTLLLTPDSLYVAEGSQLIKDGQYDKARTCLQQVKESKNIRIRAAYYFQMTILEEKLENREEAYANFVEYHNYTEEIFKEEHRALSQQEARQARLYHLFIFLLALIFVVSLFVFYKLHKKKAKEQKQSQHLLDQYKNGEIELNQLDQLIESKKCHSIQLTFQSYLIQADLFKETSLYVEIQALGDQIKNKDTRVFSYKNQEQLWLELQKFFSVFISDLRACSLKLTEKDIQLCCLSLLPINTFTKALCFGSTDTNIVKQRKFQIRKKILDDSSCRLLFEFIFEKRSK